jgi:RHS repeat-associated protein
MSTCRYTGKERDTESGLDYFGARHYASTVGRFMSPDYNETGDDLEPVPHANLEDPQSLNQYGYVGNNPLTFVDVDGHSKDCGGGGDKSVVCLVTSFWDWLTSGSSNAGSNSSHGDVAPPGGPDPNKMPQLHNRTVMATQAWGNQHPLIMRTLSGPPCTDPNGCIKNQVMPWGMTRGLGLGLTGTKAAATIAEQLALEAAEANPAEGKPLQTVLNDYRWPASKGWVKMESRSPGGVVVHWVRNLNTGEALDFKLSK